MRIRAGNGGWHVLEGDLGLPGVVYARIQEVDERFRVTELYIDGRGVPIQAEALRRLPLGALEQLASAVPTAFERLSVPGPDLSRLAAYFGTTFGKAAHWVADSMRAQYADSGVEQAPMPGSGAVRRPADEDVEPVVLLAPPGADGLTDAFLQDVSRAYSSAVSRGEPPATAIAKQLHAHGYPDSVATRRLVESWIYKARKRGVMPPASRPGRVV